jgi:sec-independent protein translocase protein TatA
MGNIGWSGIIIVAVLVVLLFGRGKISSIMGDIAKGIKSFKKGMTDDTDQSKNINAENNSDKDSNPEIQSEKDSNPEIK